jgi:hypothetical protein
MKRNRFLMQPANAKQKKGWWKPEHCKRLSRRGDYRGGTSNRFPLTHLETTSLEVPWEGDDTCQGTLLDAANDGTSINQPSQLHCSAGHARTSGRWVPWVVSSWCVLWPRRQADRVGKATQRHGERDPENSGMWSGESRRKGGILAGTEHDNSVGYNASCHARTVSGWKWIGIC